MKRMTLNGENKDEHYMRRALILAKRGEGYTSPNPMVGAVIVKDGRIIGEGYHKRFGGPHAEINAINNAAEPLHDSSFYITLEPCTHYGKTPPCIESILKTRPAEVIIGTSDPNPLVSGRGINILKREGIPTRLGVLEDACRRLNEKFLKFMRTSIPFITVKFAQTLDGRIATAIGDSKWISSEASRKLAHRERGLHDAVLVGLGTVLTDNPELTVRLARGKNPLRLVLDSNLKITTDARILQNQNTAKTIIVTTVASGAKRKRSQLEKQGIEVMVTESDNKGRIDITPLLIKLGQKGISSLLVEGGSEMVTTFLKEDLADRLLVITAPRLIGKGIEAVGDLGIKSIKDAIQLDLRKVFRSGGDFVIDARIRK